jgi:hypothetical protein
MSPFARDGHVSDLGVELALDGALDPDPAAALRAHTATCGPCAARLGAAASHQQTATLARPRPRGSANRAALWAVPLALAAVSLLVLRLIVDRDDDGMRPKGQGDPVIFEVFVDHGEVSRQVWTGDAVRAGDRLGFRIAADLPGELLIVGVDGTGAAWVAWPAGGASARIEGEGALSDVPGAVILDDRPGPERLLAVRCDGPVRFDALAEPLERAAARADPDEDLPVLLEGCDQAEVVLDKELR